MGDTVRQWLTLGPCLESYPTLSQKDASKDGKSFPVRAQNQPSSAQAAYSRPRKLEPTIEKVHASPHSAHLQETKSQCLLCLSSAGVTILPPNSMKLLRS